MKLSKTAEKILKNGRTLIGLDKPRLLKALKELQVLNLVTVTEMENNYGHKWLDVKSK